MADSFAALHCATTDPPSELSTLVTDGSDWVGVGVGVGVGVAVGGGLLDGWSGDVRGWLLDDVDVRAGSDCCVVPVWLGPSGLWLEGGLEDFSPESVPVWLVTACELGLFDGAWGLDDGSGELCRSRDAAATVAESWAATSAWLRLWTLPPETAPWTITTVPRPTTVENAATAAQPRTYREAGMRQSSRDRPARRAKRWLRLAQPGSEDPG